MRFDITSRRADELVLVFHASRQPREIQRWPSLATSERTMPLHRRSIIHIVRGLEERGLLEARPRDFAARKVGAA